MIRLFTDWGLILFHVKNCCLASWSWEYVKFCPNGTKTVDPDETLFPLDKFHIWVPVTLRQSLSRYLDTASLDTTFSIAVHLFIEVFCSYLWTVYENFQLNLRQGTQYYRDVSMHLQGEFASATLRFAGRRNDTTREHSWFWSWNFHSASQAALAPVQSFLVKVHLSWWPATLQRIEWIRLLSA